LPTILKAFGINIPKPSTSPNALKPSGITTVIETLRSIGKPDSSKDWKKFEGTVKRTKCVFFNNKINEITNKKCGSWKLMNWVKKRKLPAIEVIHFNGWPCIKLSDLWSA